MPDQPATAITGGDPAIATRVITAIASEPVIRKRSHATPYWEVAKLPGTVERRN